VDFENVIIVEGKTRLEQLIERFSTKAQAKFYIEHAGGHFTAYEQEHEAAKRCVESVVSSAIHEARVKVIDRKFLPNFMFSEHDVIVVVGQDGLVANTAKYVKKQPLIGVNPDPQRNDGVLLPFSHKTFTHSLRKVLANQYKRKQVTMAEATTHDGQTLLAFNDFFIGPASHTSARYKISYGSKSEDQSSSGLIVSTGAGSTGWLSSVVNMSQGVCAAFSGMAKPIDLRMKWNEDRLVFVVREPFLSKHSSIAITAGFITTQQLLTLESHMPFDGVIFSDGIEADKIQFNAGCTVTIGLAKEKANLVVLE
jgi:NAD kinase